jgi:glycosyltransferase involved in cell wall biosynthesis
MVELSAVLPIYNEVENLPPVLEELCQILSKHYSSWEILCVDDGSTDGSFSTLKMLQSQIPQLRIIRLRRHLGQTAALAAGFDQAKGDVIVTLDADGQNDPADIPPLVERLKDGYDVVSGWRRDRKDSMMRRFLSRCANRVLGWATGLALHDFGCTLKAYRRSVLKEIVPYGEMHRILPAYLAALGCRIGEMEVHHRRRLAGRSKYGWERTFRVLLDILAVAFVIRFSNTPLRALGGVGLLLMGMGGLIGVWIVVRVVWLNGVWVSPLLFVATTLVLAGFQVVVVGLLAEMLLWMQATPPRRRTYAVEELEAAHRTGMGEDAKD